MTARARSSNRSAFALAALLAMLAAAAPIANENAGPPRAVFLKLPPEIPEPRLDLAARRLASGAWQLELRTANFRFTEICIAEAQAAPLGHAHVYVGDVKAASAFVPVVDLEGLPQGRHRVAAVLIGQDHRPLLGRRGLIRAEIEILVGKG